MVKENANVSNICGTDATLVAHELVYEYDYGDGWEVRITVSDVAYMDEKWNLCAKIIAHDASVKMD